jgi:hypothetical protein
VATRCYTCARAPGSLGTARSAHRAPRPGGMERLADRGLRNHDQQHGGPYPATTSVQTTSVIPQRSIGSRARLPTRRARRAAAGASGRQPVAPAKASRRNAAG